MFLLYTEFHAFIIEWAIFTIIAPICLTKSSFTLFWMLCLSKKVFYLMARMGNFLLIIATSHLNFFTKYATIIDCTEVCIEQPSDLLCKGSSLQAPSTLKFLIGITPPGTVSYILKNVLEAKCLIKKSTLVYLLLQSCFYRWYNTEIKVPSFTMGKKQLEKYRLIGVGSYPLCKLM